MVNGPLSIGMRHFETALCYLVAETREREPVLRQHVHVPDRAALEDAAELIARFGQYAGSEAKLRADRSRDHGNVIHFTRWRLIERVIVMLADEAVTDTVH